MITWEACLAVAAADIWGEENTALARQDIAGVAFLPSLTIIEDAAWTLAQRHGWRTLDEDDLDEAFLIALRACHLAHRQPGHRDQPQDLADWFDLMGGASPFLQGGVKPTYGDCAVRRRPERAAAEGAAMSG